MTDSSSRDEKVITIPDSDSVTTDQLRREIGTVREIVETRIDAIDRATALFHASLTQFPTDIDRQIGQLRDLHNTRIEALERSLEVSISTLTSTYDRTLAEMDLRYQQRYDASDKALQAALLAAKEAVGTALSAAKIPVRRSTAKTDSPYFL